MAKRRVRPREIIFPTGLWAIVGEMSRQEGVSKAEVVRKAVRFYYRLEFRVRPKRRRVRALRRCP